MLPLAEGWDFGLEKWFITRRKLESQQSPASSKYIYRQGGHKQCQVHEQDGDQEKPPSTRVWNMKKNCDLEVYIRNQ